MKTLTLRTNDIGRGSLILVNPSHTIRYETAKENLMAVCPDYPSVFIERQAVSMLAEQVAANAGTITNELLSRLSTRLDKIYYCSQNGKTCETKGVSRKLCAIKLP